MIPVIGIPVKVFPGCDREESDNADLHGKAKAAVRELAKLAPTDGVGAAAFDIELSEALASKGGAFLCKPT